MEQLLAYYYASVPVNIWSVLLDIKGKRAALPVAQKETDGNEVFRLLHRIHLVEPAALFDSCLALLNAFGQAHFFCRCPQANSLDTSPACMPDRATFDIVPGRIDMLIC